MEALIKEKIASTIKKFETDSNKKNEWKDHNEILHEFIGHKELKHELETYVGLLAVSIIGRSHNTWGCLLSGENEFGKSYIAEIIAKNAKATFFKPTMEDLMSMGLSNTYDIFDELFNQARKMAPSVIYIDLDPIWKSTLKQGIRLELKNQINGHFGRRSTKNLLIIVGTTQPEKLDDSFMLRFRTKCDVSFPDFDVYKNVLDEPIGEITEFELEKQWNNYRNVQSETKKKKSKKSKCLIC